MKIGKLWMHACANIRKTKSASCILLIFFILAMFLLNVGLLVLINYGSYFDELKEELETADAYYLMPETMYTQEVEAYIEGNKHIQKTQNHNLLWLDTQIFYKDKEQDFSILFYNRDEIRQISKWKYIGEPILAQGTSTEMPVYIPDIFSAVGGYQVNDTLELKYTDVATGSEKALLLTIKGYTEDVFFSSIDTIFMSFYMPENTYKKIEEILNDPLYRAHVVFANVDQVKNVQTVERGVRELAGLHSASLLPGELSSMFLSVDLDLVQMSRCTMANMISTMMIVFALVIVGVCLLVVRFRIINSIEEDIVKIGAMKSVGYTSRQIILSMLIQFLLIAALGSAIGMSLSYPALPAVSRILEQQSGLKWEQGFDGPISFTALGVIGVIVILVVWLAARRINKLNPINALRAELTGNQYRKNRLPVDKTTRIRLPVLLAFKSILQSLKQHIMIAVILMVTSCVGAYGVIIYYNTVVDPKAFVEVSGMEICNVIVQFNPEKDLARAVDTISNMEAVRKVQYVDETKVRVEGIEAGAFVMETFAEKESLQVYEGRYPELRREATLSGILAERLGKEVGDSVIVEFGDQKETFKIVGLANGSYMGGLNVSLLTQDFVQLNSQFKHQTLNIYLEEGTDTASFIQRLKNRLDKEIWTVVTDFDKVLADQMASYQNVIAVMGFVMLAITLLVVFLVLYFIIGSTIIRKKREYGIQKAVGFTSFQLMRQISIAFTIPILLGVGAGSVLGAYCTNPLMSVVMREMGVMKTTFIVDLYSIALFGAATIVFSYFVSLMVSWRIRKISAYSMVME